jgi:type IV pilus assembly protein PilC
MAIVNDLEPVVPAPRAAMPERERRPDRKSIWQRELTKKRVPRKDLMHFSRQLAVFIKAGIPILDALEAIHEEMANKTFRTAVESMVESLREGTTFADAAAAHSEAFPAYYLGILRSAELTGKLDTVLEQLSDYIERDMEARRKVTSALTYPAVILVMAVVVVTILVAVVLPKFEVFFHDLGATLPAPTRLLLAISAFLTTYWQVIAGGLAFAVGAVVTTLRTDRGRALKDRLILRLPVLGDLMRHVILERFCRILSSMMQAGVPLPEALRVTTEATSNAVYKRGLAVAREAMLRGEGLTGPLNATGLFPPSARQMFRVGERTGTLDAQLETAAIYFERELDYKIKRFTSLFEPIVIVGMGLVVGFVAVALVSAMYGIFQSASI